MKCWWSGWLHTDIPALIEQLPKHRYWLLFQSLGWRIDVYFELTFWAFGLHGTFILGSIREPVMLTTIQQNMDALKKGTELPNIVTKPFLDCFGWMGGGGMLFCLVIAILIA